MLYFVFALVLLFLFFVGPSVYALRVVLPISSLHEDLYADTLCHLCISSRHGKINQQ